MGGTAAVCLRCVCALRNGGERGMKSTELLLL